MRYSHTTLDVAMFCPATERLELGSGELLPPLIDRYPWGDAADFFNFIQLLVNIPLPTEFDPFAEAEELDRSQGDARVQVSIDDYNKRADTVPPSGRGREMQSGGRFGHGAGRRQVVIEEVKETNSDDSKETASNMS
ncbi:hypothetical protein JCGZ_03666 [Jatropha curcas]|uniref:Uncharacterized protein n=1 Tax=Jatropha curcas TaxID=180498 RepID=A0A067JFJ4_JATCU|nr:hypothetical protein JCGZ_03666 [Jatropha curcas]